MGDASDEARARDDLERVKTENLLNTARQQAELAELRRKQAEEAAKNKMVADPEQAAPNWPDDGFQEAPGRLDWVKGALGVGAAGDAAFVHRLLNDGRPPASDAVADKAEPAEDRPGVVAPTRGTAQAFGR
ncbi:hypothetical protein ACWGID_41045 [Kribbella sp. NPDC054772]